MLRKIAALSVLFISAFSSAQNKSRHFVFNYSFTVRNVAPGAPLQVWFPRASSDRFQQVRILSQKGDLPLRVTREPEYGNQMFYAHTSKAGKSEYSFTIKYDVVRLEHLMAVSEQPSASGKELQRFLKPDKLVPVAGLPAQIATQQVKPGMSDMEKARAFYDYTFANMRYDKSGTGWGHGDTLWACNARRGNCTDFHALFISLARSQHIPARFEIGFPLPANQASAEIPGYHCWAEFYTRQHGWIPVDISEAWKRPEKKDYFFGAHDANRVQFAVGRDLELSPRQHGEPVNYFIYPYVEVDGKAYANVSNAFSFDEVTGTERASR